MVNRSIRLASGAKGRSSGLRASACSDHNIAFLPIYKALCGSSEYKARHDSPFVARSRDVKSCIPSRVNLPTPEAHLLTFTTFFTSNISFY